MALISKLFCLTCLVSPIATVEARKLLANSPKINKSKSTAALNRIERLKAQLTQNSCRANNSDNSNSIEDDPEGRQYTIETRTYIRNHMMQPEERSKDIVNSFEKFSKTFADFEDATNQWQEIVYEGVYSHTNRLKYNSVLYPINKLLTEQRDVLLANAMKRGKVQKVRDEHGNLGFLQEPFDEMGQLVQELLENSNFGLKAKKMEYAAYFGFLCENIEDEVLGNRKKSNTNSNTFFRNLPFTSARAADFEDPTVAWKRRVVKQACVELIDSLEHIEKALQIFSDKLQKVSTIQNDELTGQPSYFANLILKTEDQRKKFLDENILEFFYLFDEMCSIEGGYKSVLGHKFATLNLLRYVVINESKYDQRVIAEGLSQVNLNASIFRPTFGSGIQQRTLTNGQAGFGGGGANDESVD